MSNGDERQERSMVVAGRVDVVKIAEIMAGLTADKFNVRTLSLLLSYCVEISHSAMEQNSLLTTKFDGPLKAFNFLSDTGILTRHMQQKNIKKMKMAQGLDEIRQMEGNPSIDAPDVYNTLHNTHSTQVPDTRITTPKLDEMVKAYKKLEAQELIEKSKAPIEYEGKYILDENGAIIPNKITPKLECPAPAPTPAPATDIPDEAATIPPVEQPQPDKEFAERWKNMTHQERLAFQARLRANHAQKVKDKEIIERERERLLKKEARKNQTRTSKGASNRINNFDNAIRQKTSEEIEADFARIAKKDKEQAMLDMSKPVN
jgi:hypothetical protein